MWVLAQSDIDQAMHILKEEVATHPLYVEPDAEEVSRGSRGQAFTEVIGLGDICVEIQVWAWAKNEFDALTMEGQLLKSIKQRFQKVGIEIPFPQRVVILKK